MVLLPRHRTTSPGTRGACQGLATQFMRDRSPTNLQQEVQAAGNLHWGCQSTGHSWGSSAPAAQGVQPWPMGPRHPSTQGFLVQNVPTLAGTSPRQEGNWADTAPPVNCRADDFHITKMSPDRALSWGLGPKTPCGEVAIPPAPLMGVRALVLCCGQRGPRGPLRLQWVQSGFQVCSLGSPQGLRCPAMPWSYLCG